MCAAMNQQIKYELESYYIYLSMAAYFHAKNLDGMAHWMRCQAHEEMVHTMRFFDHVTDRGGKVALRELSQPQTEWETPQDVWNDAYAQEKFITGTINELIKICREEGEYAAEPILNWFANEQIEEEASTEQIAGRLSMVQEDRAGVLMIDRDLAQRTFPAVSPLNPAAYRNETE